LTRAPTVKADFIVGIEYWKYVDAIIIKAKASDYEYNIYPTSIESR